MTEYSLVAAATMRGVSFTNVGIISFIHYDFSVPFSFLYIHKARFCDLDLSSGCHHPSFHAMLTNNYTFITLRYVILHGLMYNIKMTTYEISTAFAKY